MADTGKHTRGKVCMGGKFTSIGDRQQQAENAALMVRLCGEIGIDGYELLGKDDRLLVDDVRFKLNRPGNKMFGWRQVEAMVRVHKTVVELRKEAVHARADR